jgi:arylsulfatase A-like enzyme
MDVPTCRPHARQPWPVLLLIFWTVACTGAGEGTRVLAADMPLHLEDHLDAATFTEISAADVSNTNVKKPIEWSFDQPQPDWKATPLWNAPYGAPVLTRTGDGLRVTLGSQLRSAATGQLRGALRVDVPDWDRNDWAEIVIRARADAMSSVSVLGLGFNLRDGRGEAGTPAAPPFQFAGEQTAIVRDGTVRAYRLRINVGGGILEGPWRQLVLFVGSTGVPGSIDLLSVTVVPKGAAPVPTTVDWHFDQPQPDWRPTPQARPGSLTLQPAEVMPARTNDSLRVTLSESSRRADKLLTAGIHVDLPGWRREEWAHIVVRARTSTVTTMNIGLNLGGDLTRATFARSGGTTPIVSDGTVQTYQIRPDWGNAREGPWLRIGLSFRASEPGSIDILSVSVVPIAALYAGDRVGSGSIAVAGTHYRRAVFAHSPGRFEYTIRVPQGGRLYTALGVLNSAIGFRVTAGPVGGDTTIVLRETHVDPERWAERTVDLSSFAGQTITLGFETTASEAGAVAFWGSPMISGSRRTDAPNVIFYIIDGGGSDQMSLYGYNRRTTPNLERLAREGAVFEHAYSTALWTGPSTATFMTSLHNSVLGNTFPGTLPSAAAPTMAERFHAAGYSTAAFTSNPNAGTLSGLQRGVDVFRDQNSDPPSGSSLELHREFWNFRAASSSEPYWVHFQTTDVHRPHVPPAPFAGVFAPGGYARMTQWSTEQLPWEDVRADTGIDRRAYYDLYRALYDESLAHQDYQLGRFVERLRQSGEAERTLLVIAADHSVNRGSRDFIVGLGDDLPPAWSMRGPIETPIFRSSRSRVPLMFIWPGHIAGGQRFRQPVSMIDVLPTLLDLAGLPALEVQQGQSLAPLLLGRDGWRARPVIFDEFRGDRATGQLYGAIEVVDGRWGASRWIGPGGQGRPAPVVLYDVWDDPQALRPVNDARPDLVKKYTEFLEEQWKAHETLAKTLTPGGQTVLTPEQLERLRALGYIR